MDGFDIKIRRHKDGSWSQEIQRTGEVQTEELAVNLINMYERLLENSDKEKIDELTQLLKITPKYEA